MINDNETKGNKVEIKKINKTQDKQEIIDYPMMFFDNIDGMLNSIRNEYHATRSDSFKNFRIPYDTMNERVDAIRKPLIRVKSNSKNYYLMTEVPGLDKEDIEVSIKDNILKILGESKESFNSENEDSKLSRLKSTRYYRKIALPRNIHDKKIIATLDKGILKIKIPKLREDKSEEIRIEVQ